MIQQPPTSGKVILDTSHGELDIELWCKEVPKGCKNFIQLCLEGYYDQCAFHRLIPNFMIQGGDPTGTGEGGKSIYGEPFQDEINSKLTFSTRGMLAYSNSGPNTNESQFFITFDSCPWLDKKHTIFGKVVGDTIYNLMAISQIDTNSLDQPLVEVMIKSANVVINPFSIQVRVQEPIVEAVVPIVKKPVVKKKNTNILSFQEDDEEGDQGKRIQNSHDVLDDPLLKKQAAITTQELEQKRQIKAAEEQKKKDLVNAIKQPKSEDIIQKKIKVNEVSHKIQLNEEDQKLLDNYRIVKNANGEIEYEFKSEESSESESEDIIDEVEREIRLKQKQEYENLKAEYLSFKELKFGSNNALIRDRIAQDKKLMTHVEERKARFIASLREQEHDLKYQEKVKRFQDRLVEVKQDQYHWLNHKLKFHIDSNNAFIQVENKTKVQDYKADQLLEPIQETPKARKDINQLLKMSEI